MTALIDEYLPAFDFAETHRIDVHAGSADVFQAIKEVTTAQLLIFRLLMAIRLIPAWLSGKRIEQVAPQGPLIDWADEIGFKLAEQPGRELVFGIIGQFWKLRGGAPADVPDGQAFIAFSQPGYARVATNFLVTPDGSTTRLSTETRIQALDPVSRRRFAAYWRVIYPGSSLIRHEWMWAIKRQAEG